MTGLTDLTRRLRQAEQLGRQVRRCASVARRLGRQAEARGPYGAELQELAEMYLRWVLALGDEAEQLVAQVRQRLANLNADGSGINKGGGIDDLP
jgi:hypothetical protein